MCGTTFYRQTLRSCLFSSVIIAVFCTVIFISGCGNVQNKEAAGEKISGSNIQSSQIESQKGDIECDSTNYTDIILRSGERMYAIQLVNNAPVLVEVFSTDKVTIEIPDSNSNRLIYYDRVYAIIVDTGDSSLSLVEIFG